jgi:hypothetical protein
VILGSAAVAFGQTIQYVLEILKETSIGFSLRGNRVRLAVSRRRERETNTDRSKRSSEPKRSRMTTRPACRAISEASEANDGVLVGEDADAPLTRSIGLVQCSLARCWGGKVM